MKLNQDFGMAVKTIVYLKNNKHNDYIQSKEIAKKMKFSVGYLQKVVQTLSRHGIIECKRGRIGGIRMKANRVTLLDLWEATCGMLDVKTPAMPEMKVPLTAFKKSMKNVIIYSKTGK